MNTLLFSLRLDLLSQFLVFAAGSYTLNWIAAFVRKTSIGSVFAFTACCVAAYSFGCALEICLLQVTGIIPVQWAVLIAWVLLGVAGFAIVETAKPNGWLAMLPCCIVGVLMVMQGPLTREPFAGLRYGQYALVAVNLSLLSGIIMMIVGAVAGLVFGAGYDPAKIPLKLVLRQYLRGRRARRGRPTATRPNLLRIPTQASRIAEARKAMMVPLQAVTEASARVRDNRRSPLRKLYVQVLVAIALGVTLGHYYPSLGAEMKPLSDGFIMLVRSVVPPIIFVTVAVGIAKMGDMRRVGAVGIRALVYFELVSTLALVVGLAVGNLLQPGAGLHIDPHSLDDKAVASYVSSAKSLTVVDFLMKLIPRNIVGAVAEGDLLQVLVIAVLFGVALCHMGERGHRLVGIIDDVMQVLFGIVRIVMYLAPLAAFGAMAFTVGKFGFGMLASLGQLLLSVYVTSILFALVGFGLIARLFGLRVWGIIRYFKEELLIAFVATSGEAMIPRSMAKLRRIGCSQETIGLVLPTGFSFNTDGSAIYMSLAVLFIAQATDIHLTYGQQLTMLLVMLFTSKGAAGVAGAGFVALAATLPTLGILPIGGLALLLGVERFMSEIRAVTNLFSNIFATIVISKWMGELDGGAAASNAAAEPARAVDLAA
jgi:aerobic C4-dicarboxylate transport protein